MYTAEYVWKDAHNQFRSKCRVIDGEPGEWNYDGSSTGQATLEESEVILTPVRKFKDPFRENGILVLCDSPSRQKAMDVFTRHADEEPWFGIEQEYYILTSTDTSETHYCGVGKLYERGLPEKHLQSCLKAGVKICGINAEVAPKQWEYQIGICSGIEAADHLEMSRYILVRIAEEMGVEVSFHPKPYPELSGSGCHTNFSTKVTRGEGGTARILSIVERLCTLHKDYIGLFGEDNHLRLTGKHETSSLDQFSWGIGNRGVSVRIPNQVWRDGKGYLEDRRPAANCDPYVVTSLLLLATK